MAKGSRSSTGCRHSSTRENHRAAVPRSLPIAASQFRPRIAAVVSLHVVDQKLPGLGLAQGNMNRLLLGLRRLQPASIDLIKVGQAGDEARESARVVGLRRIARLQVDVESDWPRQNSAQFGSKTTDRLLRALHGRRDLLQPPIAFFSLRVPDDAAACRRSGDLRLSYPSGYAGLFVSDRPYCAQVVVSVKQEVHSSPWC